MTMNQTPDRAQRPGRFRLLRVPLFRLLAINLAVGVTLAAVAVGGLLALNPGGLRHLIFADASPGTALGLHLSDGFLRPRPLASGKDCHYKGGL